MSLAKAPVVFISGGSRGIGLAVALALARVGAKVTIAAKTKKLIFWDLLRATPHPKLPGTIYTAAEDVEKAGGQALPLVVDIRSNEAVEELARAWNLLASARHIVENSEWTTASKFGGIDIVINNASAISLTTSDKTSMKTYDLMNSINSRGTYLVTKTAVPHLLESSKKGRNPHILTFSPPLEGNLTAEVLGPMGAYAIAKVGMSLATLAFAGELRGKVASNALWPLTYISTEAIRLIMSEEGRQLARDPSIMADAAFAMLNKPSASYTGQFEVDEIFLRKDQGYVEFENNLDLSRRKFELIIQTFNFSLRYNSKKLSEYGLVPFSELQEDLFIPQWVRDQVEQLRSEDPTSKGL
ncbi:BQ2448_4594 [Microbotryum intermedium]|uniref:BQ2448_4594 protein n=1 Tax=Microbotryum intermedium TaxID=269621 RepID=A0A238FDI7_9BASI|nr:BQ2448_4594 [Microbotryum intermedium]